MAQIAAEHPQEVVNTDTFIIEEVIEGVELAIDGYFNKHKQPVVLGIYEHYFATKESVNDRIYMTSANIMREHLSAIDSILQQMAEVADCKNFPFHMEVRRSANGLYMPIELNPGRFGGWCSTADLSYLAFGINPYVAFYQQRSPDWQRALEDVSEANHCLIILDNSTGHPGKAIESFNFEALKSQFEHIHDVRPVNHERYSLFGFVMVEVDPNRMGPVHRILNSDLTEFITMK